MVTTHTYSRPSTRWKDDSREWAETMMITTYGKKDRTLPNGDKWSKFELSYCGTK